MLFLCKNCGTLYISSIKSDKTYQNRAKNVKIVRKSIFFKVFQRYFYAFTLRHASLGCLSILRTFCVSLLSKEVGKTATDGIRILLVTLCPNKKSCSRYRAWIRTQHNRLNKRKIRKIGRHSIAIFNTLRYNIKSNLIRVFDRRRAYGSFIQ